MKTNTHNEFTERTHNNAPAARMTPLQALRRSVLSCFLWEKEFYEDGEEIAARIGKLVLSCDPADVARLAIEARNVAHLRHVPLLLLVHLAKASKGTPLMRETVPQVVKRADELTELPALWWKLHSNTHMPHNMEKGLRAAFNNFGPYGFAKYNRDGAVKLRDVLRIVHPHPGKEDSKRSAIYKSIIDNTLESPDTWEVALSAGADKRATFERLMQERALGGLAFLRNLRNMQQAGVDRDTVAEYFLHANFDRVLPFRFVAAARAVPAWESMIDNALCERIKQMPPLSGNTLVLCDVSGSMDAKLSTRSDLTRMDAAATLASIIEGSLRVWTFSNNTVEVPPRRGMAGVDAIKRSQYHGGTQMFDAIHRANQTPYNRIIVITDEQADGIAHWRGSRTCPAPRPGTTGYMINVASAKNGVGYANTGWTHIDGFSENVIKFIIEVEKYNDAE